MNGYAIQSPETVPAVAAVLAATLLAGLGLSRLRPGAAVRIAAWLTALGGTMAVERLCADEPAGVRMAALIVSLLWGMKAVVAVEAADRGTTLSAGRYLAFAAVWPGMRPAAFATLGGPALPGAGELVRMGLARIAAGAALIAGARMIWLQTGSAYSATVPLFVGVSLVVHFGLFNVLASLWRFAGCDCRRLWVAPLCARSLDEFWSRRWNLAFSEMIAAAVYRPLAARLGAGPALAAAFAASGLLHELAISVPPGAGFGLPTAYFALQGALVMFERRFGNPGQAWTAFWVVAPLPLLFHRPFLVGTVWPISGIPD